MQQFSTLNNIPTFVSDSWVIKYFIKVGKRQKCYKVQRKESKNIPDS